MNRAFRRHGDAIRMQLRPFEHALLERLVAELREVLEADDRADPVTDRLFPTAGTGDEPAELRDLLHDDLLGVRRAGVDALADLLDRCEVVRGRARVDLVGDESSVVLGVLNDIRLALGVRVGADDLDRTAVDEDDPRAPTIAIMDHLAWLQEQLLGVVDPESLAFRDEVDPD